MWLLCCFSPATSLEEMQKQQRLIEELNKKKKAMLQETIQQRLVGLSILDGNV